MNELTDDEEFINIVEVLRNARRRPQTYKERPNFFELPEGEFIKRFRFSKDGVRFVINLVGEQISAQTERNHAVTTEQQVLLTLRFYATGSFLQVIGDFGGIDKGTASRVVWKVTKAIAQHYAEFIRMPSTTEEFRGASQKFYNISKFPKCIGALDCTHIKILSPGGETPEIFRNRKGFFSMNVQAICDADCMFLNVVCRWPGSTHDSHIFRSSNVRGKFERNYFDDNVLVGDSGYPIRTYLITPLANPQTRGEQLFNEAQIRTRNCVERKFGQWKRRFPILAFGIRLKSDKIEGVVIATAVLDNIAKLLKEPNPPNDLEEEAAVHFVNDVNFEPYMNIYGIDNANSVVRHQLINNYFSLL